LNIEVITKAALPLEKAIIWYNFLKNVKLQRYINNFKLERAVIDAMEFIFEV
jgi:hypothetical protein